MTHPPLPRRWTAGRRAELAGDATALAELIVEDFRAIGPLGFVLDKAQ